MLLLSGPPGRGARRADVPSTRAARVGWGDWSKVSSATGVPPRATDDRTRSRARPPPGVAGGPVVPAGIRSVRARHVVEAPEEADRDGPGLGQAAGGGPHRACRRVLPIGDLRRQARVGSCVRAGGDQQRARHSREDHKRAIRADVPSGLIVRFVHSPRNDAGSDHQQVNAGCATLSHVEHPALVHLAGTSVRTVRRRLGVSAPSSSPTLHQQHTTRAADTRREHPCCVCGVHPLPPRRPTRSRAGGRRTTPRPDACLDPVDRHHPF